MSQSPPVIHAEHLLAQESIAHGFFGREGGISTGIYDSLNVGPGSDDDKDNVRANRAIVAEAMGAETPDHLISLFQIHSPNVVQIDEPFEWGDRPEGDAMVTATPGLALCVLTADCTPVLFADTNAGVIGAAHAGWRGALAGVIEATIEGMEKLGANATNIVAAIGPSLSPPSFQVGPDLKAPFIEKHAWSESLFTPGEDDRSYFDIWKFCEGVLLREGVKSVDCVGEDTLTQPTRYFSNRYRVKNQLSDYGRNASVITLRKNS
ncbi:peptidoglycan editing factor PgeF [Ponticaulis sp.]|uniref:peptidoglycan editing factor PgeF n=1 Tax=Ponticaulis sp. TaxID=2020902 RepID=UPI000B67C9A9|nr:peptidoglycan editing factor PgeF [Ponticaulis sp.]MAI89346.1 polyphenol oxidase [Ponticaulis sp.]OUY00934.1 MAG: hypothetical protein CBB65_02775 [Hyphomonadaceae bacterium TMED5]|tara:strand:- start:4136 stop:4927 length:792 start_codon:yes stop_codon:yes gene_type:complete